MKAVIFDLDGTLVNSIYDIGYAVNRGLKILELPEHQIEAYYYFVGDGTYKLIERALPESKRDKETIEKLHTLYLDYYNNHFIDKTVIYEGINELIEKLKERKILLSVVTNKPQSGANLVINSLFDKDVFDSIKGVIPNIPVKPNPARVIEFLNEFNLNPEDCLYVGDTNVDMQTAHNAKIKAVGVTWGFRDREELVEHNADVIIDNPLELLELL